jgi:hypothetical protein
MAGFGKISAAVLCLLLVSGVCRAEEAGGGQVTLQIRVRVYNMAKVQPTVLSGALGQTGTIYRRAGVEIEWIQCPCNEVAMPSELHLRIIPRLFPTLRGIPPSGHLGYAAATENGGVLATIFYDRVEDLALLNSLATILGYGIAHELGHLLLGKTLGEGRYHSATGLMRAKWDRNDIKGKTKDGMDFALEDTRHLREGVIQRTRQPIER